MSNESIVIEYRFDEASAKCPLDKKRFNHLMFKPDVPHGKNLEDETYKDWKRAQELIKINKRLFKLSEVYGNDPAKKEFRTSFNLRLIAVGADINIINYIATYGNQEGFLTVGRNQAMLIAIAQGLACGFDKSEYRLETQKDGSVVFTECFDIKDIRSMQYPEQALFQKDPNKPTLPVASVELTSRIYVERDSNDVPVVKHMPLHYRMIINHPEAKPFLMPKGQHSFLTKFVQAVKNSFHYLQHSLHNTNQNQPNTRVML